MEHPHPSTDPTPLGTVMTLRTAPVAAVLVAVLGTAGVVAVANPATTATSAVTPTSLFSNAAPRYPADPEVARLEVGTAFTTGRTGTVTRLKFFKHYENTGTHYGKLYDAQGRLLTSIVYTGETRSGWQTVQLPRPVTITAGRSYVVSYTTAGHYAADPYYFAKGARTNGPLTATKGVYRYGSGFPTSTWHSANYYADVEIAWTATSTSTTTSSSPTASPTTTSAPPAPATSSTVPTTTSPTTSPTTTASPTTTTTSSSPTSPTSTTTGTTAPSTTTNPALAYYGRWSNGPRYATTAFPYGVWMQDPVKQADTASQWRSLGVNTYVGIWNWPSGAYAGHVQAMLDAFAANQAQAFAGYTGADSIAATRLRNGSTIRGSILRDEPDMDGTTESQLATLAAAARTGDPTRPTYVNFSKGIVNGWNLSRSLSLADKQAYCASADIPSVDFYGFTDPWEGYPGTTGYARAMDQLRAACGNAKPLWAFVETTRPFSDGRRITADQFEAAVWTLLASGADGIELFIHDFGPGGMGEDALLRDPAAADVKARVGVVGAQIRAVAPLLHQADTTARSSTADVRVLGKQGGVVAMNLATSARTTTVTTSCAPGTTLAVTGEGRTVTVGTGGTFTETFSGYQHRTYTGAC